MTSFETNWRYSPYLIDTAGGVRVFVGTEGVVTSHGVPMSELLGASPQPASGKEGVGERPGGQQAPGRPRCVPGDGRDSRQG